MIHIGAAKVLGHNVLGQMNAELIRNARFGGTSHFSSLNCIIFP